MTPETLAARDLLIQELTRLRERAGLSQAEVARRMQVRQPRISEFERLGDRSVYLDTLMNYAEAVGARIVVEPLDDLSAPDGSVAKGSSETATLKKESQRG